jgi:hypothetical protein
MANVIRLSSVKARLQEAEKSKEDKDRVKELQQASVPSKLKKKPMVSALTWNRNHA